MKYNMRAALGKLTDERNRLGVSSGDVRLYRDFAQILDELETGILHPASRSILISASIPRPIRPTKSSRKKKHGSKETDAKRKGDLTEVSKR